ALWNSQWSYAELVLAGEVERLATGGQHLDVRRCLQHARDIHRGWQHVFEIIQDEQPHAAEGDDDRLVQWPGAGFGYAQSIGDARLDAAGVVDCGEIDEQTLALDSLTAHLVRQSQCKPGLAGATRTRKRQEANVRSAEQLRGNPQVARAPDQRRS